MEPVRYQTDPFAGLTHEQARDRTARGYVNTPPPPITKSAATIFREHACTLFNLIHVGLFVGLLLVGSYTNLTFMGVIVSNLLIGIVQELRSKRTVEKLRFLHAPSATVIRESEEAGLKCEEIVLDDVLVLGLGDQIPTDCIVLEGAVEVDESLLTGESNAVLHKEGDVLLSGSFIVAGACRARVDKVGSDSYATSLTLEAKKPIRIQSNLMRSMRLIIRILGAVILPLGALLFLQTYFNAGLNHSLKSAMEQTAAGMIGMIPSGLMLLTSMSLAVGVVTLSRKNALVQEIYSIETLARVDMLCLDKTGTLTTGEMQVDRIECVDGYTQEEAEAVLGRYVHAIAKDNATAKALYARFHTKAAGRPEAGAASGKTAISVMPFSSSRRYSAAGFKENAVYVGAPDALCSADAAITSRARDLAAQGYRVLALCVAEPAEGEMKDIEEARAETKALILLQDQIRPEAMETLRFFEKQGVKVKLISGDNPLTVSHIARRLQLKGHDTYLDVSTLASDEEILEAAQEYTVFGRVSPHAKRLLCRALKQAGHTVAMTGDGVNDLLALREADCSIALFNGSDAARQASHIVLLSNDFSMLPRIVMEGRRVINNITRMASLFLVKTIYSFLLTVSSVLFALSYPFQPIQLSLISVLTVGIPSFFLALEPNRKQIKGNFLKNVFTNALPGACTVFLYTLLAGFIAPGHGLSYAEVNTLCVYLTGTACLMVLLRVCLPLDKWRAGLFTAMAVCFFLAPQIMPRFFNMTPPNGAPMFIMYAVAAVTCYPILLFFTWIVKKALKQDTVAVRK